MVGMKQESDHKLIRLQGLSFREELAGDSIDFSKKIVYLSIVPWEFCNWNCQYCHQDRRFKEENELTLDEISAIIEQAGELGIKSLLLLGGEMSLDSVWETTRRIIFAAHKQGLITIFYTNGSQLTQERVCWLADHNVSLALKVDSLEEEKYDTLTGRRGAFRQTMQAIEMAKITSIGSVVSENKNERLVRLLFTTVGNSLNIDEYVSLARFATIHQARWMMEYLNHRGDVDSHPHLSLDIDRHSKAMQCAMLLNPEQEHFFQEPCRLFSCITVRKRGEITICPQDYDFQGNIRDFPTLEAAIEHIQTSKNVRSWQSNWTGVCPIKNIHKSNQCEV